MLYSKLIAPKRPLALLETLSQYRLTTSLLLLLVVLALINALLLTAFYPILSVTYIASWIFVGCLALAYWLVRHRGFESSVLVATLAFLGFIGVAIYDQLQRGELAPNTSYWLLPFLVFAGIVLSERAFLAMVLTVALCFATLLWLNPALIVAGYLRPLGIILSVCGIVWYSSRLRYQDQQRLQKQAAELEALNARLDDQLMIKALEVALVNDERVKTEDALRSAQRLQTLGVSASTIAHDFRNMVAAARMQIELGLRQLDPDHPAFTRSIKANDTLLHTISLINQLLVYTGELDSNAAIIDVGPFVMQTCESLQLLFPKEVLLEHDLANAVEHYIWANPAQLQQLVMNLVLNAAESVQGAGYVRLNTERIVIKPDSAPQFVRGNHRWKPGNYVMLQVIDNGSGMSPETQKKIFDPFFSTKAKQGRGLGMAAIVGILEDHNALLALDSAEGVGTTFSIYFPSRNKQNTAPLSLPSAMLDD